MYTFFFFKLELRICNFIIYFLFYNWICWIRLLLCNFDKHTTWPCVFVSFIIYALVRVKFYFIRWIKKNQIKWYLNILLFLNWKKKQNKLKTYMQNSSSQRWNILCCDEWKFTFWNKRPDWSSIGDNVAMVHVLSSSTTSFDIVSNWAIDCIRHLWHPSAVVLFAQNDTGIEDVALDSHRQD